MEKDRFYVEVHLWGKLMGIIGFSDNQYNFQYDADFSRSGLDVSPIEMPSEDPTRIFTFPNPKEQNTFRGLPGLLADSLPDDYGNEVLNAWLSSQGRGAKSLSPLETMCFIGSRGMGALEFRPPSRIESKRTSELELDQLVKVANRILNERKNFSANLSKKEQDGLTDIIKIGTSAGGARAKAIIAFNEKTKEVRTGQVKAPKGFTYWLIKFDGVEDKKLASTKGYGRIEMAYHLMARKSGIEMMDCQLLEENGRAHFMTKRFDRTEEGEKLHTQTFCALRHFDFAKIGSFSYEQLFETARMLSLPYQAADQLYRRMVFNVLSRNCDDHTKNFGFLMRPDGEWSLSPAYDLSHSYSPKSIWVSRQCLSINMKLEDFHLSDMLSIASQMNIKNPKEIIQQITDVVEDWEKFARECGVPPKQAKQVRGTYIRLG